MKTVKKLLASLLVVVMVLCSAPLQGFVGLELPSFDWIKTTASAAENERFVSGIYTYTVDIQNFASIIACDSNVSGAIEIPSYLDEYKVTSISENSFSECSKITEIIIPDTIEEINDDLSGCSQLEKLVLSPNIKSKIGDVDYNKCISNVQLFADKSIILWSKIRKNITLNIGADVSLIPKYVYDFSWRIEKIVLDPANKNYSMVDGVLYNCDVTKFYMYPVASSATSYIMPDTVEWSSKDDHTDMFFNALNLKSITIGANFNIGNYEPAENTEMSRYAELLVSCNYIFALGDGASHTTLLPFAPGLEEIKVSPNHKYLTSKDGILCLKDDVYDVKLVYPARMSGDIVFDDNDIIYQFAFLSHVIKDKVYFSDNFTYNLFSFFEEANETRLNEISGDDDFEEKRLFMFYGFLTGDFGIGLYDILKYSTASGYIVDETNPYFSVDENGLLYSKDKKSLVKYPIYSDLSFLELPDVDIVYNGAFMSLAPITMELHYPENLIVHMGNFDMRGGIPYCKQICTDAPKDATYEIKNSDGTVDNISLEELFNTGNEQINSVKLEGKKAIEECEKMYNYGLVSEIDYKFMSGLIKLLYAFMIPEFTFCEGHEVNPAKCVFGDWQTRSFPTCTQEGVEFRVCSECGKEETRTVAALGHDYSTDWIVDKDATCTADGLKSHHCSRCDSKIDETVIPATGHSFGEWTVKTAPTCTASGVEARSCSACGMEETRTVSALGHDYSTDWIVDKEATCIADGIKSHHCSRCDSKIDETIISATGHSIKDGICEKCGEVLHNHADENHDGSCDICGKDLTEGCGHLCHKTGFLGFIWKIVLFFIKLFHTSKTCSCGMYHY